MRKSNGITIQEIARRAGVGVGTVSRVLNDSPNVTNETRHLVQKVIAEVGYRRSAAAKTLRTRKTHEIGFITDEIATTPYAVDVIRGAQDAAWALGKILVLINTNRNPQLLVAAVETMLERQVEGLIYAAMYHQQVTLPPNIYDLPAVLVDCFTEDRSLPSVVPDEAQGGRSAIDLLLQQGHRRIGFINHTEPIPATMERLEGYKQALTNHGIAFDPSLVVSLFSDPAGGYDATKSIMQHANPPTALFYFNDRMAMGGYDALRKLGLSVPSDVAVVSFDNQEIIAGSVRPGLTSMQLPHYAMGQWAVNYLFSSQSHDTPYEAPQVKLECPVILRESHG